MRQGGSQVAFTQQVDTAAGRIDITHQPHAATRRRDRRRASLAACCSTPSRPAPSRFAVSGVASGPGGRSPLQFTPATVTVQ